MTIKVRDFVIYKPKSELGLVGKVDGDNLRCWFNIGGTKALVNVDLTEVISVEETMSTKFANEYAKLSLIERSFRLKEGGDVTDLIDDKDIRIEIITQVMSN